MKIKILIILASIALLAACGKASQFTASFTGHSVDCIDGVNYIQFSSGATVKYNQDGKISTCVK